MSNRFGVSVLRCVLVGVALLCIGGQTYGQIASHQKISNTVGGFTGVLDDDDLFGWVPANVGDLDSDGVNDLAVGTPGDDDGGDGRGAVWILFLNANGTVKSHQKISDIEGNFTGILHDADGFGHSLMPIGDFDNDGVADLAVGALGDDEGAPGRGALWLLFLMADGTVKSHQKIFDLPGGFPGTPPEDNGFGHGITLLGKLDADEIPDLATATGHNAKVGVIWVLFMNADGTVKSFQRISAGEGNFSGSLDSDAELGHDLDALGDLDGDGVVDLAAGLRHEDDGGDDRGGLFVLFLNADGTVKSQQKISDTEGGFVGALDDGDVFGHPPANAGDLDGDGVIDLLVGAPFDDDGGSNLGAFWILYMNENGTVKGHEKVSETQGGFSGDLDADDLFSHVLTSMGDLNFDGLTDFAVGAPHDDDGGRDRGAIWVMFSEGGSGNLRPTAAFGFSAIGLQVNFTDTSTDSDGTVLDWLWDFGDGNISTEQNPTHVYAAAGTYTVSLTVTDNGGLTNVASESVIAAESALAVAPVSVDFGKQEIGTTSPPELLTLTATGGDTISVTGVSILGPDAGEFAHDFLVPGMIPAGGEDTFGVTFTPASVGGATDGALYRINGGGPLLPAEDAVILDWEADVPSPYVNDGDTRAASFTGVLTLDGSVPAGTPQALFQTYRRDASWASLPNMEWNFPVVAGSALEVRLYWMQSRRCSAGEKIFDIEIEGAVVLGNYDVVVDVGCNVGVMKSFMVTPTDGNLDIDFVAITATPPLVSGIEVVGTASGGKMAEILIEHTGSNASLIVDLAGEGISSGNLRPTAAFGFSANGLQVNFTDTSTDSDGTVVAWLWDFGDGNVSTEQDPTHVYAAAGTYTVSLTVTDNGGLTDMNSESVIAAESTLAVAPVSVDFGQQAIGTTSPPELLTLTVVGGEAINVTGVSILGPDASEFAHDYVVPGVVPAGGQVTFNVTFTPASGGKVAEILIEHTGSNGSLTIDLAGEGVSSGNLPPTAAFGFSANGLQVNFTDSSTDGDGTLVAWLWDFGDGNVSTEQDPTHVYAIAGTYTVSLTVTDNGGLTDMSSDSVMVSDGSGNALYRINGGGPLLPAEDGVILGWEADLPSPYVNNGDTRTGSVTGTMTLDGSVPAGTPQALFQTYRRDGSWASLPNMEWDFPVVAGIALEVRLYWLQSRRCSAGEKIFDIEIEGAVVLGNYDVVVDVGCNVGVMKSFMVTPTDGNLDIDFVSITATPPLVSGIEILH